MFPVADGARSRQLPLATWFLVGINALVFVFELELSRRGLNRFIMNWGLIPHNVLVGLDQPLAAESIHAFLTLITAQFIHGGWLHIIGNMLFLVVFGPAVEEQLGSIPYLLFYVVCGIVAGLVQIFVVAPMFSAQFDPNIGASGAIAGVLGAYLILHPGRWVTVIVPIFIIPLPLRLPAFILIGWWFIQQLFYGVLSLNPADANSGVAFWAHVGGFIAGMLFMIPVVLTTHHVTDYQANN